MNLFKLGAVWVIGAIIANFVLWGGLIYFGFWCAKHFGLIA